MKKVLRNILAVTLAIVITINLMITGLSAVSAAAGAPYAPANIRTLNSGTGFNITNSLSASSFDESIIASYETSRLELEKMSKVTNELIVQIYGKTENMITEHCLVSQHYFQKKIKHCHRCKGHTYTLVDRKGYEFTLFTDERCRNHILHNVPLLIESYGSLDVSTLLFFLDEEPETIKEVLKAYKTNSFHEYRKQITSTSGYYKA